jgi:hypothetical protein
MGWRNSKLMRTLPDLWRKLSIWVAIPCLLIASVNAWRLWKEHWEHKAHDPPVEERTEYPFMNIRNKAFPWGDGDKVRTYSAQRRGYGTLDRHG